MQSRIYSVNFYRFFLQKKDPIGWYNQAEKQYYFTSLSEEALDRFKNHPNVASVERIIDSAGNAEVSTFPNTNKTDWNRDNFGPIYIPEAGKTVEINRETLPFYKRIIETYEGEEMHLENKITTKGTQVLLNGSPIDSYTFKQNYYFMMGDNRHNSEDSRYWGYVPENHVVGKPVFVWMSWDANGEGFSNKIRWERLFTTVGGDGKPVSYFYHFLIVLVLIFGINFFWKKNKNKEK